MLLLPVSISIQFLYVGGTVSTLHITFYRKHTFLLPSNTSVPIRLSY